MNQAFNNGVFENSQKADQEVKINCLPESRPLSYEAVLQCLCLCQHIQLKQTKKNIFAFFFWQRNLLSLLDNAHYHEQLFE